jgi:hypothetical protein
LPCLSVCLSICPHVTTQKLLNRFHPIWYWGVLLRFFNTFQFFLKSDHNNGYFTWNPTCISMFILSVTHKISCCRKEWNIHFRPNTCTISLTVFEIIKQKGYLCCVIS